MKRTILLTAPFLLLLILVISSCNVEKNGNFASRKYTKFDNRQAAININKPSKAELKNNHYHANSKSTSVETPDNNPLEENTVSALINSDEIILKSNNTFLAKAVANSVIKKSKEKTATTFEKGELTKSKPLKKKKPAVDELLLIILAIIIPPLAVYLVRGISDAFWINILLSLFCIGGVIHALYIVLTDGGGGGGRGSDQRRSGAN